MARLARIVIAQVAQHVTQRENWRLPVFFGDDDRRAYLALLAHACAANDAACLAWCLMDNRVHLIPVPQVEDGLRAVLGEAHRRYTRRINFREGWRGDLFQARFARYPMDAAHLMAADRHVENNPVAAGMVAGAADWPGQARDLISPAGAPARTRSPILPRWASTCQTGAPCWRSGWKPWTRPPPSPRSKLAPEHAGHWRHPTGS